MKGTTYSSRNQCHHCDWHLTRHFPIIAGVGWEQALKAICKRRDPSGKVEVAYDQDDVCITVWSHLHGKKAQWIALKEC